MPHRTLEPKMQPLARVTKTCWNPDNIAHSENLLVNTRSRFGTRSEASVVASWHFIIITLTLYDKHGRLCLDPRPGQKPECPTPPKTEAERRNVLLPPLQFPRKVELGSVESTRQHAHVCTGRVQAASSEEENVLESETRTE
ncbi:hypothetical protein AC578_5627 [Pseudocercospora eumusae]|uniref:Uncharacterized protein n=1 Tax=Pseudocercospora eumusae TaxID=321146 RepID=A0A139HTF0_9PEZI|nr:hypothetical protein AC578_5627 [Pseudocercospora eumusae]